MKSSILPLAFFLIAFSSCTTAYKSGQTPDDVYFSPARPEEEYVRTESKEEPRYDGDEYYDDQYLRMKVRNRYRWSDLDDPYYNRRSYSYNAYSCCYCKNSWTPSAYWNYYYNPYYNYNVGSKTTVYTAPRKVNLAAYNPQPQINTKGYTTPRNYTGSTKNDVYTSPRNSNRSNDDGNSGNILRSIFNSNSNTNSSSGSSNSNSSSGNSNTKSSSSSSSGSSGSSAPVRKF